MIEKSYEYLIHLASGKAPEQFARFWSKVEKTESCWNWIASKSRKGYGKFWMAGRTSAHRASWRINKGPIPQGLWVLHRCDNPSCVRLDHLFLGTNSDNMKDCADKGRLDIQKRPWMRWGERNHKAKLTNEKVGMIRSSQKAGRELAKEFGVSETAIRYARSGKSWQGDLGLKSRGI